MSREGISLLLLFFHPPLHPHIRTSFRRGRQERQLTKRRKLNLKVVFAFQTSFNDPVNGIKLVRGNDDDLHGYERDFWDKGKE